VSADGENWALLNASPDLRQQINDNEILHPKVGLRHSPIKSIVLTNADVDHVAGLLNLRESQPLNLYGTERVLSVLRDNNIFNVLNPQFVSRKILKLDGHCELSAFDETELGLTITPFAVPGKVALWLEDKKASDNFGTVDEDTIALEIMSRDGAKFFYVPACAQMTPSLANRLENAELVFFDGTLWVDDEMIKEQVGVKTGRRMGHMSVSGETGTLESFASLNVKRKIFIHINTTNPILASDSVERQMVSDAGWEVAQDGMDIKLTASSATK
jgi:pyrroloquinoline quinone biosynthesis protein B